MNWHHIITVYLKELRDSLRDRRTLTMVLLSSVAMGPLVLMLLAKFVLLTQIDPATVAALLLIPAWARLGPLVWVWWLPPLHGGMGDRFAWQRQPVAMLAWAAALIVASFWLSPKLLVAPILIAAWGLFLKRRLGGQCGDALGAGIEVTELGLLLALAILSGIGVDDFWAAVRAAETGRLVKLPGIGKKTAERIVIELRDKAGAGGPGDVGMVTSGGVTIAASPLAEARAALESLGYKPVEAQKLTDAVHKADMSTDQIIREALKRAVR